MKNGKQCAKLSLLNLDKNNNQQTLITSAKFIPDRQDVEIDASKN